MWAFMGIDEAHVTGIVVNSLAVGGGFLAGFLLTGFIIWLLQKQLPIGNAPEGLKKVIKGIGGMIVAVIVALILFSSGGQGDGGKGAGGGPTDQKGEGNGTGQPVTPKVDTPPTPPAVTPPDPAAKIEKVRVKVLTGADVKEGKYYLVEGDPSPRSVDELFAELKKRKDAGKKVVQVIPVHTANGGEETIGATRLRRRGVLEGITVDTPEYEK